MALNLPGIKNPIFQHSKEVSTGMGKERLTGEIIVSKDGSGDFDKIQDAINSALTTGRTIRIRNGIYDEDLILKSNIILKGDGWGTQIIIRGYTGIEMSGMSEIEIKDLKITITATTSDDGIHIDINNSNKITFNNVFFEVNNTNSSEGIMWTSGGGTSTDLRILNCKGENTGTGNCSRFFYSEIDFCLFQNNYFKNWQVNATDAHIDHSIINKNFLSSIYFMAGSDNNVAVGNCLDSAVTNLGTGNQVANNSIF